MTTTTRPEKDTSSQVAYLTRVLLARSWTCAHNDHASSRAHDDGATLLRIEFFEDVLRGPVEVRIPRERCGHQALPAFDPRPDKPARSGRTGQRTASAM